MSPVSRMKRTISQHGYPLFEMPAEIEYWSPSIWNTMIEAIPLHSFREAGRLAPDSNVQRVHPIDSAVFNDEGDEWVLSLVELELEAHGSCLMFLPLMRTILPASGQPPARPIDRRLLDHPELIAFGVRTRSRFFATREWVTYDALLDEDFLFILARLLWSNEAFSSLDISASGHGDFLFRASEPLSLPEDDEPLLQFDDARNLTASWPGFRLSIQRDLRSRSLEEAQASPETVGWIEHRSELQESVLIAALERTI